MEKIRKDITKILENFVLEILNEETFNRVKNDINNYMKEKNLNNYDIIVKSEKNILSVQIYYNEKVISFKVVPGK